MSFKKIAKIVVGVVVFFTLPSLLFFAFVYFKYNEELPNGVQGAEADALATKMLQSLDYQAYKETDSIEFTFKNRHHFKWHKSGNTSEVYWKNYRVSLDFDDTSKHRAFENEQEVTSESKEKLIQKAIALFNNDTFWVVAPYKVFDVGTERRLVNNSDGSQSLLVTYTSGGSTPGDSYLWHFDSQGKPKSFQMWVDILPIGGLEATWSDWVTTDSGAQLPSFHKLMILGLDISNIKTSK